MYQKMYFTLFNALTDALEEMGRQNFGRAAEILKEAQAQAEEIYLEAEE